MRHQYLKRDLGRPPKSYEQISIKFEKLNPWQKKAWYQITKSKKQYLVLAAGRRAGKTTLIRQLIYYYAFRKPYSKIAVVYPTLKSGKEILFRTLEEDFDNYRKMFKKIERVTATLYFANNSVMKIHTLQNPNSLRGNKYDFVIIDEAQEMTDSDDIMSRIIDPTLAPTIKDGKQETPGKCLICGTSKGRNDFYDLLLKSKEEETKDNYETMIIPSTSKNCPHIVPGYLEQKRYEMDEFSYNREFLCDFSSFSGLVYPTFDRKVHIVDSIPSDERVLYYLGGIDFGFSPHPLGMVVVAKTLKKDEYIEINNKIVKREKYNYYVMFETKKTNLDLDNIVKLIVRYNEQTMSMGHKIKKFYLSPEENQMRSMIRNKLNLLGLSNISILKGNNRVVDGLANIRNKFYYNVEKQVKPSIYIFRGLKETINELEKYEYDTSQKNGEDKVIKLNDDILDALRYCIYTDSISGNVIDFKSGRVAA